jgi:hypothetical protein
MAKKCRSIRVRAASIGRFGDFSNPCACRYYYFFARFGIPAFLLFKKYFVTLQNKNKKR